MSRAAHNSEARAGFTLLELVIVLAVMAIVLAMVAPRFTGFGRGQRLENAVDDVLAAAAFARSQAIATATPHRLEVAGDGHSFWVSKMDGEQYVPVAATVGEEIKLPDALVIEIDRDDGAGDSALDFYPSGRTTPAVVTLAAPWGRTIELAAEGVAEPLRRVRTSEGQ